MNAALKYLPDDTHAGKDGWTLILLSFPCKVLLILGFFFLDFSFFFLNEAAVMLVISYKFCSDNKE